MLMHGKGGTTLGGGRGGGQDLGKTLTTLCCLVLVSLGWSVCRWVLLCGDSSVHLCSWRSADSSGVCVCLGGAASQSPCSLDQMSN